MLLTGLASRPTSRQAIPARFADQEAAQWKILADVLPCGGHSPLFQSFLNDLVGRKAD